MNNLGVKVDSDDIDFYNPDRLGDLLFIFHTNHKKYLNDLLSQYDLNLVQVLCLLRLCEGAITKSVKKLEENGFIIREKSQKDKRQYILKLTSKGRKIIPIIEKINEQWENEIDLKNLPKEFYEIFKKITFKSVELNS